MVRVSCDRWKTVPPCLSGSDNHVGGGHNNGLVAVETTMRVSGCHLWMREVDIGMEIVEEGINSEITLKVPNQ